KERITPDQIVAELPRSLKDRGSAGEDVVLDPGAGARTDRNETFHIIPVFNHRVVHDVVLPVCGAFSPGERQHRSYYGGRGSPVQDIPDQNRRTSERVQDHAGGVPFIRDLGVEKIGRPGATADLVASSGMMDVTVPDDRAPQHGTD